MKNTPNHSLLNDAPSTSGYGTFSEPFSAASALQKSLSHHNQIECGRKRKPIACATLCGNLPFPTTLVVKNDGSTARDNFSIERNFLSWLRFSLALMFVGMSYYLRYEVIPPALPENEEEDILHYSSLLGLFFIILGNFVLIWALSNYFQFQQMLAYRCAVVQHEFFHFLVAAFVGVTIFMACIFNILEEEKSSIGKGYLKGLFTWWFSWPT